MQQREWERQAQHPALPLPRPWWAAASAACRAGKPPAPAPPVRLPSGAARLRLCRAPPSRQVAACQLVSLHCIQLMTSLATAAAMRTVRWADVTLTLPWERRAIAHLCAALLTSSTRGGCASIFV